MPDQVTHAAWQAASNSKHAMGNYGASETWTIRLNTTYLTLVDEAQNFTVRDVNMHL
jgi:hypothetical protein